MILLAACSGELLPPPLHTGSPDNDTGPGPLENAAGTVSIRFSSADRTLLPTNFDTSKMKFVLTFHPNGGGSDIVDTVNYNDVIEKELTAGSWTLGVKGFISTGITTNPADAVASGEETFTVATGNTSVHVTLNYIQDTLSQEGTGTLRYNITIPAGASGTLEIFTYPEEAIVNPPVNLTAGINSGDRVLNSNNYYLHVVANYNGNVKVWRELAYIYDDAITPAVLTFLPEEFTGSSTPAITSFGFASCTNDDLVINDSAGTITVYPPPGTNASSLTPVIGFTGAMISPPPIAANFTSPVTYTIHTEDGKQKAYIVTTIVIKSVTDITDIPTGAAVGTIPLDGTVNPGDATNQSIIWSIGAGNAGTTGAAISGGNNLTTTAAGTVTVTATIADGVKKGTAFTDNFPIEIIVPVTNITGVPTKAHTGDPLTLTGIPTPTATNKTIVWSIVPGGTTAPGAAISGGNTLNTTGAGTVTVRATISNGKVTAGALAPYTQDFVIDVVDVPSITFTMGNIEKDDKGEGIFTNGSGVPLDPFILSKTAVAGGDIQIIMVSGIDVVEWKVGDISKGTADTVTLYASEWTIGAYTLTLSFKDGEGTAWLASLPFEVTNN